MSPLCLPLCSFALTLNAIAPLNAITPPLAQRPTALVGSWRATGLTLTLNITGEALIYEQPFAYPPQLLERSRWWVEGEALCLTAGLSRVCEPYTLSAGGLNLPARGVTFTRQPPRPRASSG